MLQSAEVGHVYLAIAGIPGSGKQDAVNLVADTFGCVRVDTRNRKNSYQQDFKAEPNIWAFHFETDALTKRLLQMKIIEEALLVRSVVHAPPIQHSYTFAEAQRVKTHMSAEDWKLYTDLFNTLAPLLPKPTLTFWLEKTPGTDDTILLRNLNMSWFDSHPEDPVHRIDVDQLDLVGSKKDQTKFIDQLTQGLQQHGIVYQYEVP